MLSVAIAYENSKPIRAFKDESCIYNAYKWLHKQFNLELEEPRLEAHQLPEDLDVKYYLMSEEEFNNLIK